MAVLAAPLDSPGPEAPDLGSFPNPDCSCIQPVGAVGEVAGREDRSCQLYMSTDPQSSLAHMPAKLQSSWTPVQHTVLAPSGITDVDPTTQLSFSCLN